MAYSNKPGDIGYGTVLKEEEEETNQNGVQDENKTATGTPAVDGVNESGRLNPGGNTSDDNDNTFTADEIDRQVDNPEMNKPKVTFEDIVNNMESRIQKGLNEFDKNNPSPVRVMSENERKKAARRTKWNAAVRGIGEIGSHVANIWGTGRGAKALDIKNSLTGTYAERLAKRRKELEDSRDAWLTRREKAKDNIISRYLSALKEYKMMTDEEMKKKKDEREDRKEDRDISRFTWEQNNYERDSNYKQNDEKRKQEEHEQGIKESEQRIAKSKSDIKNDNKRTVNDTYRAHHSGGGHQPNNGAVTFNGVTYPNANAAQIAVETLWDSKKRELGLSGDYKDWHTKAAELENALRR